MTHSKLFDLIITCLDEEQGDGDAHVDCVHRTKEEVADMFEKHLEVLRAGRPWSGLRRFPINSEHGVILFSDGCNENVAFADAKDEVKPPSWVSLWVRL